MPPCHLLDARCCKGYFFIVLFICTRHSTGSPALTSADRLLCVPLQDTASLAYQQTRYWLGLTYSNDTYLYEWFDGTDAGSGPPSEYPYAHFVYNFQDLKGSYPTWTCTAAWSGWTYDM